MFKKITALFLVMSFTQVHAVTPVQQTLSAAQEMNRAFDELNYRINVEWDQTDSKYMKEVYDAFGKEIATLQAQGLSAKELTQYTLEKIKDKQTREEINAITKSIAENKMSSEEARDFAISKLNSMYSHGTSWSGSRMHLPRVALILGLIAVIYCLTRASGHDGSDGSNGSNGTNGTDGTNGTNGTDGATGPQGPAGPAGPQGPAGPTGPSGSGCPEGYYYKINGNNGTAICHVID